jgi:hypothetical protein
LPETEEPMFAQVTLKGELFSTLEALDRAIARRVAASRCPACGGPLHADNYPRKPRGALIAPEGEAFVVRFGVSAGREGRRRRATPPSLRFLGRLRADVPAPPEEPAPRPPGLRAARGIVEAVRELHAALDSYRAFLPAERPGRPATAARRRHPALRRSPPCSAHDAARPSILALKGPQTSCSRSSRRRGPARPKAAPAMTPRAPQPSCSAPPQASRARSKKR